MNLEIDRTVWYGLEWLRGLMMNLPNLPVMVRILFSVMLIFGWITAVFAQSGLLQLNLLLEDGQKWEWSKEYPVWIAQDIPARIVMGKLEGQNTLIGLLDIEGMDAQLVLHGAVTGDGFTLHEWFEDSYETAKVELEEKGEAIMGYWYSLAGDRRFQIESREITKFRPAAIHQYQYKDQLIFTISRDEETLINADLIYQKMWNEREQTQKNCYRLKRQGQKLEFCETGNLRLYNYHKVGLVQLLHGALPQIPHDEIFNSYISRQLSQWESMIFTDNPEQLENTRWSENRLVWFDPDYISDEVVSGLLSVQFSGDEPIHSFSILYDVKKRKFYTQEDYFRSGTQWSKNFQEMARKILYENYQEILDFFPEAFDEVNIHLTLTAGKLLLSTDFSPYFGRLTTPVSQEILANEMQKYAPFRHLLDLK